MAESAGRHEVEMRGAGWFSATVVAARDVGGALRALTLRLPREVAASHRRPGQYVKIRAGGKTSFFALANAPGGDRGELLVKRGGATGDALARLSPGAAVELSEAEGPGFPV
jgi:NAD(P)H-flavin reductase